MDEYLVVWSGDRESNPGEEEIHGQRLDATGAEVGSDDWELSVQGGSGFEMGPGSTRRFGRDDAAKCLLSRGINALTSHH